MTTRAPACRSFVLKTRGDRSGECNGEKAASRVINSLGSSRAATLYVHVYERCGARRRMPNTHASGLRCVFISNYLYSYVILTKLFKRSRGLFNGLRVRWSLEKGTNF